MPRQTRELLDGGSSRLIARGNNRLFLLTVEGGFDTCTGLLVEAKRKYPWHLAHYCLMSTHLHLLGQLSQGAVLPKRMQFLLFEYSRWYRTQTG